MIKEAYVSFEVAKLLKDKGFGIEEETRGYYPIKGDATGRLMLGAAYHHNTSQVQISAPTHQMAMVWLREEKNILLWVYPKIPLPVPSDKTVFKWSWEGKKKWHSAYRFSEKYGENSYDTPEEAVEAALRYTLENLI